MNYFYGFNAMRGTLCHPKGNGDSRVMSSPATPRLYALRRFTRTLIRSVTQRRRRNHSNASNIWCFPYMRKGGSLPTPYCFRPAFLSESRHFSYGNG